MSADADGLAVVQYDDPVGVHNRADPLGDNQRRDAGGLGFQPFPQHPVGLVVEGGEGVVEDIDFRFAGDRPGDREPLLLAAGEVGAALGDRGVYAVEEVIDKFGGLGD